MCQWSGTVRIVIGRELALTSKGQSDQIGGNDGDKDMTFIFMIWKSCQLHDARSRVTIIGVIVIEIVVNEVGFDNDLTQWLWIYRALFLCSLLY